IGDTLHCADQWNPLDATPGGTLTADCATTTPSNRTLRNPLLPDYVAGAIDAAGTSRELFALARERLRVLSADSPKDAVREYRRLHQADADGFTPAQRYGYALARSLADQTAEAGRDLAQLATQYPSLYWIALAQAENDQRAGNFAASRERYEALLRERPQNSAIILSYATSLAEQATPEAARTA